MVEDISRWIGDLSAEEADRRLRAAERLARLGEDARGAAVPLARAAADPAEPVREWAVAALEDLGPPDTEDAAALADLLADAPDSDTAYWAATLIGRLGADGGSAAAALTTVLQQSSAVAVRQRAAWALGRIGPAAAPARGALQEAARSEDPRLARLAARAIEEIGQ